MRQIQSEDLFLVFTLLDNFSSHISNVLKNQDMRKTLLAPKFYSAATPMITKMGITNS